MNLLSPGTADLVHVLEQLTDDEPLPPTVKSELLARLRRQLADEQRPRIPAPPPNLSPRRLW